MNKNLTPEEFIKVLAEKKEKVNSEIGKAVTDCCIKVQQEIVTGMTTTKVDTTKTYYTHNKIKGHHPSLAGEYPAVDTGTMRRSITFSVEEKKSGAIGKVGSTIKDNPYPKYLEFGTSKMPQGRPWLKPSLKKAEGYIKERLKAVIKW
ncbi:MAG: hypothetical protein MJ179_02610 [Treponema sp.]|nr:hypothetical protein [Treponema sp.]